MIAHGKNIKIFAGNSHPELAEEIANLLGLTLGNSKVSTFSDGEISVDINETVRGADVFIVQSTSSPVNNNLMELLIMIDAFKRASAGRITAVIPYYGYARQDRKAKSRDPITAKLVADILTAAGADRVLTMDLHASQIQGYFNIPVDHLLGSPILAEHFIENGFEEQDDVVVVSPDLGSVTRARKFADKLHAPIAIIDKRRPKANVSEIMNIIGDVKDKRCILIDDMIDTAGTIGYAFLQAGNAAFALMMSVLCAGIAYSICGKPGIAPGVVAGYLSTQVKASFLGALICGFLIGIMILWMQEHFPDSKALKSMYPIVIYPVISGIIATLLIMFVFGPPLAALTQAAVDFFMNMNTGSKFLLGFILGCMTGFDMGGPVNKICFSVVSAFAASGIWGPAAGKNAAAMAPPMGMAISALVLTPKNYTEQEREDAKVAIAMSLCQVTEGALPFAFNDPKRVIPAVTIGSGVAHGLILTWGVTVPVLHGGIFSVPLASNPMLWIAAWLQR